MIEKAGKWTFTGGIFLLHLEQIAGVAQLVERDLPKVDVEGSKPFSRSKNEKDAFRASFFVFSGFLPCFPLFYACCVYINDNFCNPLKGEGVSCGPHYLLEGYLREMLCTTEW